ncbi:hypothetical protein EV175_002897 [Coemansia sp. RSA 1933]|nr:hypothetical protein EV175_002897 [Coemansia sp. RSA 1933]
MQVKAIGQFPKLLDQFPFPTLVSSAFFKLGDLFRSSPNSMRYHIAQVFESSQHHLLQITHSEELLKRIISVLYSNDPIARVLALRLVGNASILFAKYPEAQHGVLLRYQSTHPLEIAAAVQTTELMLKYSPELLKIVWETVISKANDCQVSDPVRAQLIHSLQHAASNLQLSARLYDHCRTWLNEYVEAQLGHPVAIADYSCIRLAMIALARVECAPGYTSIPRCWELAEAICGASLHVLRGDASRTTTTALDYIQNNSLETNMYDTDGASLQASVDHSCVLLQLARTLFQGASPTTPEGSVCQMYRAFVRSVMIAVNVASVFKDSNIRQAATNIVASAWCTVAQLRGPPYETGYTKKFLRVTWKWCRSVGTDSTLSESLSVLLDGQNQCVLHANMAILASERSISEQIAKEYMPNIGQFANSFDSPEVSQGQHSTSVIWKSIAASDPTSSIARVLVSAKRNSDLGRPVDLETTCKEISSCIAQSDALNFVVGPSFFFRQVNPEIDIETRPDLEGNNATVVSSGSQFHFTIEGFIRLPVDKLPAAPRRVNVAAWLSRHAFNEESSLDLELCAQFSNTAWNANTGSASQVGNGHIFAMEDVDDGTAWNTIWNAATVFSAKIDTTYFECPCALAIPSLHSLFGHVDTNMSAHVHVICALVDSSDRVWYIGPHRSYPLMISTTEKS